MNGSAGGVPSNSSCSGLVLLCPSFDPDCLDGLPSVLDGVADIVLSCVSTGAEEDCLEYADVLESIMALDYAAAGLLPYLQVKAIDGGSYVSLPESHLTAKDYRHNNPGIGPGALVLPVKPQVRLNGRMLPRDHDHLPPVIVPFL